MECGWATLYNCEYLIQIQYLSERVPQYQLKMLFCCTGDRFSYRKYKQAWRENNIKTVESYLSDLLDHDGDILV